MELLNTIEHASMIKSIQIELCDEKNIQKVKHELNLKFASCYINTIFLAITNAIHKMKTSNRKSIILNLTSFQELVVEMNMKIPINKIPFHIVHYKGSRINGQWKMRNINLEFSDLFRQVQRIMYKKGYFLLDTSDPSKSHNLGEPSNYSSMPKCWHDYNKLDI